MTWVLLDRVPGRLGDVLPSRWRGPPEVSARELLGVPPRVLLHPVVGPALGPAITQTRSATGLIRNVMLEVASGRGPPAARPGTPRVPDLRQVPEHHPGIMPPGLPPVITVPGRQRPDLDQHLPGPGGEPPGAVPAGRPALTGGSEGEPGTAGRIVPAGCLPSRGPGAAVPDRVPVLVGDRHAPGGPGVAGRGSSQVAGQVRVDGPDPAQLTGPAGAAGHGGLGDGQGDLPGEPGRDHPGQRPARARSRDRGRVLGLAGAVRTA